MPLEAVYVAALGLLFALVYQAAGGSPWRRLAWAWAYLLALSGTFRILMLLGERGPGFCLGVFLAAFLQAGMWFFSSHRNWRSPRARDSYWIAMLVFLAARSLFPAFDVDSLFYHLAGVRYFAVSSQLGEYQRHLEVASLWYNWLGPEELLLAPMAARDLALAGGLLGGCLKIFSAFTVVALVPAPAFLARVVAVFLLLWDDHFFFSGQCKYVYLNPSLIGLLALATYATVRAWKSPDRFAVTAICMALGAALVKLHGLIFLVAIACILAPALLLRRGSLRRLLSRHESAPLLGLLALGALSFFGVKWLTMGSPLAPFDFLLWKADHAWRDPSYLRGLQGKRSFAEIGWAPWRAVIFPGVLALKGIVVLFPIAAIAALFPRLRRGWLGISVFLMVGAVGWALISHYLYSTESRYPRYALGIAALALVFFSLALWGRLKPLRSKLPGWLLQTGSHGVSLLLLGVLFFTIDTRYFNVPTSERPTWQDIGTFLRYRTVGHSLDPAAPYFQRPMLNEGVYSDVEPLLRCLRSPSLPPQLRDGVGLAVFPYPSLWPTFLIAPAAAMGSALEGGGRLREVDGQLDLQKKGIAYALVPRDATQPTETIAHDGAVVSIHWQGEQLCESPHMRLLKLP